MALTDADLQALRRFSQLAEGRLWMSMLSTKLAACDEKLRRLSGDDLIRMQGRAQQLEELLGELSGAGKALARQEQPTRTATPLGRPGARALT